jgi:hypothetical protein
VGALFVFIYMGIVKGVVVVVVMVVVAGAFGSVIDVA